jgi:GT2 family glycosyltransferase
MRLSIVIICWNDWNVIEDCLYSIVDRPPEFSYEVIVSDNSSTDGSVERIRAGFPSVQVIANSRNLGFAGGNNAGIRAARGDYVLILNPDTIVHENSLKRWVAFADRHPEAGAFGCSVRNPDGSYQESARPFPTVRRALIAAFGLRPLGHLWSGFLADAYPGWKGDTEREVDWQSGCCVMFRGNLLRELGGFDERFFYHYDEVDLCHRVWNAGYRIRFTPEASITHLGGQSAGRLATLRWKHQFPVSSAIETYRNAYRYYHKYFGMSGARRFRRVLLLHLRVRQFIYGLLNLIRPCEAIRQRLAMYRATVEWNKLLNPVEFIENAAEPLNQPLTPNRGTSA